MIRLRIVDLGVPHQVQLYALELLVEVADQGQVGRHHLPHALVGELLGNSFAVGGEAELLG